MRVFVTGATGRIGHTDARPTELDLLGQSKGTDNAVITRAVNSSRLTLPNER